MPVPVSETVVGLLVALLVTVTAPVRVPVAVGVKVTLTVHEAPAAGKYQARFHEASAVLHSVFAPSAQVSYVVAVSADGLQDDLDHAAQGLNLVASGRDTW